MEQPWCCDTSLVSVCVFDAKHLQVVGITEPCVVQALKRAYELEAMKAQNGTRFHDMSFFSPNAWPEETNHSECLRMVSECAGMRGWFVH